jgi:hypothetical protein
VGDGGTLFVIVGAGAPYDAATGFGQGQGVRPPLVRGLFEAQFNDILNKYPMAKNAAPDIRDAIAPGPRGSLTLEDFLRDRYRNSSDELDQRRFWSLPLYLQEVLWSVGWHPALHFDHYDRLINQLLASFDHVCFVTLNYDLLLDRSLAPLGGLATKHAYIAQERWSLIKLHGSVSWGRQILDPQPGDLSDPQANISDRLGENIFHTWNLSDSVDPLRRATADNHTFPIYPALAVPLGSDDELVCPPEHETFLRERLSAVDALDLLIVGYSAYDQSVVRMFREAERELRTLAVINQDESVAAEAAVRFLDGLGFRPQSKRVRIAEEGFGEWAQGPLGAYPDWVRQF